MSSTESIKSRLKNIAIIENSTVQNELILYAIERSIYRISISKYNDKFILKGGIFLYAIFDRNYPRATQDIDLLANNITNDITKIKDVFADIFSFGCDDCLKFDLNSLSVEPITEFKEYHGLNVSILAYLDRTKIPVSIDIGYGDVICPNRIEMEFPVLLDMPVPKIFAYSIYSVVAEKFEAFVSLGILNSRYKDYYDIYVIAKNTNLDGKELQNAITETFDNRKTSFDNIVTFSENFKNSNLNKTRWRNFIKKKQVSLNIDFIDVINLCEQLLLPVVNHIKENQSFTKIWDATLEKWI